MAKNENICDCNPINPELVRETKNKMLTDKDNKVAEAEQENSYVLG